MPIKFPSPEEVAKLPDVVEATPPLPQSPGLKFPAPEELEKAVPTKLAFPPPEELEAQAPEKESVVEAFLGGAEEALSPFTVTKEELTRQRELPQTIARIAGTVTAGIAGATAAAAAGPVALGMYALYAGLGREQVRTEAEGEEFSFIRGLAGAALEINPVVKASGPIAAALRTAGQVGGEAALEYSYSKDKDNAMIAGGVSLLLSPLIYRGMKTNLGAIDVNASKNIQDYLASDEGLAISKKAITKVQQAQEAGKLNIPENIDDMSYGFKKWVTQSTGSNASRVDVEEAFQKEYSKMSRENIQDAFFNYKVKQQFRAEARQVKKQMQNNIAPGAKNIIDDDLSFASKWFKDGKFAARDVDAKLGTNMEGLLDKMSEDMYQHEVVTAPLMKKAEKLIASGRKYNLDRKVVGKALSGAELDLTTEQRQVVKGWRELLDESRNYAVSKGYNIGELQDYFPMQTLNPTDLAVAMDDKFQQVKWLMQKGNITDPAQLTGKGKKLFSAIQGAGQYRGLTIKSLADAESFIKGTAENTIKTRKGYQASALFSREGEMPTWMRNYDVGEVFLNYVNTNLKSIHLSDSFQKLDTHLALFKSLGMKNTYNYYKDYMAIMSGGATGELARTRAAANNMKFKIEKILASQEAGAGEKTLAYGTKGLAELYSFASNIVYPSYLALNVRAHLRNLTQPIMKTAPELGTYGYGATRRGVMKAAYDMAKGVNPTEFLKSKNLMGAHVRLEDVGKEAVTGATALKQATNWMGDKLMYTYGMTDTWNRYVTYQTGVQWAKDLVAGKNGAVKAIKKLPPGAKRGLQINDLIEKGDVEELGDYLGRHLISTTQFHYGKTQRHKAGHHFGKMASMFTKWPTMTISDVVDMYKREGGKDGTITFMRKYMGQYLSLMALGMYVGDFEDEPMMKYLIGPPKAIAPLATLESLVERGYNPPQIAITRDVGKALLSLPKDIGNEEYAKPLKKLIDIGASNLTPGVSPVYNELNRWKRAHGEQTLRDMLYED